MITQQKLILLKEKGITLTKIATIADCAPQTLAQFVRGERNLSTRLERDVEAAIKKLLNELNTYRKEWFLEE